MGSLVAHESNCVHSMFALYRSGGIRFDQFAIDGPGTWFIACLGLENDWPGYGFWVAFMFQLLVHGCYWVSALALCWYLDLILTGCWFQFLPAAIPGETCETLS